ncbi:MAG TPA: hypothetical protein VHW70_00270 [Edaphobacter sp.]|nr:hypothetical protein [Edaphobacter sp.]
MNFVEQEIVIRTNEDDKPGIPISIGGPLLSQLEKTVRPCVRMALTGRSKMVGHPPQWLRAAWDFRALGFDRRGGDTILHIAAPTLGDAAPRVFEQQSLWEKAVRPTETALDLFGKMVDDVRAQAGSSDAYDDPLLQQLAGWHGLLHTKVKTVRLPSVAFMSPGAELDESVIVAARALSSRIPSPRQIRLVGRIDMVRWSTRSMAIQVADGTEYRCAVISEDIGDLGQYGGREVTVLGKAIYRPTGSVLRLDIEQVLDTTVGRAAHSEIPLSFEKRNEADRRRQTSRNGISAVFGSWPGEESDEELLEGLSELRR